MIIVVDALNKGEYEGLLREMFRLRARVFQDRLGWEVTVRDGMEMDEFDQIDPAYLIAVDDEGAVVGCMRILQTTGPHMLSDVFYSILGGEPPLRDPLVWEATRFCVDTERLKRGGRGRNSISYVTSEIMISACEYAMSAGVTDAIAVIDPIMNRVMIRSNNAPYDYLGAPTQMGKVVAMAGLLDCTPERVAGIREFSGISDDVFATPEEARALADPAPAPASNVIPFDTARCAKRRPAPAKVDPSDLLDYCLDQIRAARTEEERAAAEALAAMLTKSFPLEDALPDIRA